MKCLRESMLAAVLAAFPLLALAGNTTDVSITKTAPASALAGNNITYTITVADFGSSPGANVSWTDVLPAGTSFVSVTQNTGPAFACSGTSTVTCSAATLASGSSAQFSLVVKIASSVANGTV